MTPKTLSTNAGIYDGTERELLWESVTRKVDFGAIVDETLAAADKLVLDSSEPDQGFRRMSENAPAAAYDALELQFRCRRLRIAMRHGLDGELLAVAYLMGRAAERLNVRPHEHLALRGKRNLTTCRNGHAKAFGRTSEEFQQRDAEIKAEWQRQRAANPREQVKIIDAAVGTLFDLEPRTIRRIRMHA